MKALGKIRFELVSFELETLALLLHYWAEPDAVKRRKANWKEKLPKFRSAVIAGMSSGSRERSAPHELIDSDYREILKAIRWLKKNPPEETTLEKLPKWIKCTKIPYNIKSSHGDFFFERPVPVPEEKLRMVCGDLVASRFKPSEIAYQIVGDRFGCSESKVKYDASKNYYKRFNILPIQRLLIGIFLDLCSLPEKQLNRKLLAKLLNTLFGIKCHLLVIYYMIQRAHALDKKKLFVGEYDYSEVEKLCEAVHPYSQKIEFEPFLRLI